MQSRRALLSVFVYVEKNCSNWERLLKDLRALKVPFEIFFLSNHPIGSEKASLALSAVPQAQWLMVQGSDFTHCLMEASALGEGSFVLCLRSSHRLINVSILRVDIERLQRKARSMIVYEPKLWKASMRQRFLRRLHQVLNYKLLGVFDYEVGFMLHSFTFKRLQTQLVQTLHPGFLKQRVGLAARKESLLVYFRRNVLSQKGAPSSPHFQFMGDALEVVEHFWDLALFLYGRKSFSSQRASSSKVNLK